MATSGSENLIALSEAESQAYLRAVEDILKTGVLSKNECSALASSALPESGGEAGCKNFKDASSRAGEYGLGTDMHLDALERPLAESTSHIIAGRNRLEISVDNYDSVLKDISTHMLAAPVRRNTQSCGQQVVESGDVTEASWSSEVLMQPPHGQSVEARIAAYCDAVQNEAFEDRNTSASDGVCNDECRQNDSLGSDTYTFRTRSTSYSVRSTDHTEDTCAHDSLVHESCTASGATPQHAQQARTTGNGHARVAQWVARVSPRGSPSPTPQSKDHQSQGQESETFHGTSDAHHRNAAVHDELASIRALLAAQSDQLTARERALDDRVHALREEHRTKLRAARATMRAHIASEVERRCAAHTAAVDARAHHATEQHRREQLRLRTAYEQLRATNTTLKASLETAHAATAAGENKVRALQRRLRALGAGQRTRAVGERSGPSGEERSGTAAHHVALNSTAGGSVTGAPTAGGRGGSRHMEYKEQLTAALNVLEAVLVQLHDSHSCTTSPSGDTPPQATPRREFDGIPTETHRPGLGVDGTGVAASVPTTESLTTDTKASGTTPRARNLLLDLAVVMKTLKTAPSLQVPLLRFVLHAVRTATGTGNTFSALRHNQSTLPLSRGDSQCGRTAALRRLGVAMGQPEAPGRSGGLQNSSCVHTRVLAGLVALHTLQQADLVAVALDGLRQDLLSAQGKRLFHRYDGMDTLLWCMHTHPKRAVQRPATDVLLLVVMATDDAATCFHGRRLRAWVRWLLRALGLSPWTPGKMQPGTNPAVIDTDVEVLEKLAIVLQKLSKLPTAQKLLLQNDAVAALKETMATLQGDVTHQFLALNLRSVLLTLDTATS
eukprot:m.640728 g.640728  ORF g.640728 m.640728 type:complete len:842 (+) comp22623_c0_seq1:371-2896(+)